MALSDSAIRTAKPQAKPYKLADGGGMFLLVNPNGSKLWRIKYRVAGKEKSLSLGAYPEIGLKEARERREATRKLIAQGIDPSAQRQATKATQTAEHTNTLAAITQEWLIKKTSTWESTTAKKERARLENDLLPWLGSRPIASITAPDLLTVFRRIEERGAHDTARRVKQLAGQVFRYAIATGRTTYNPIPDLQGALMPVKQVHHAAITEPKRVAELLRALDGYSGTLTVKCALKLAPLIFVRPGELRQAEWAEIDLESALWSIPAGKMKTREPHLVPLSTQAIAILRDIQPLTGKGRYVFPGARCAQKPMSDNAILAAMRRMEIGKEEMSGHGFRAMARTVLDEILGFRPDYIEHQLAHAVRDPNGRAYNRTTHLAERRRMMQDWADYLDQLKNGAVIVPFQKHA
ncbi:MAG: integrase arm-type DNA-binding domain-containing protein [Moraxellaceae bacterium]|nr:integrase arm-type DNA-binding domain-containing protein [Moraxellaceae bacterium]